jgi:hypothetical protein
MFGTGVCHSSDEDSEDSVTLEQAMKAQRVSRHIALLFL